MTTILGHAIVYLIDRRGGAERVLTGQEGRGHQDTDQDDVTTDRVALDLPAHDSYPRNSINQ